jgi:hypothetical protein
MMESTEIAANNRLVPVFLLLAVFGYVADVMLAAQGTHWNEAPTVWMWLSIGSFTAAFTLWAIWLIRWVRASQVTC